MKDFVPGVPNSFVIFMWVLIAALAFMVIYGISHLP